MNALGSVQSKWRDSIVHVNFEMNPWRSHFDEPQKRNIIFFIYIFLY